MDLASLRAQQIELASSVCREDLGGEKKWLSVRVCRRVLFWHFRRTRCLASDKHIVRITYEQDSTD